MSPTKIFIVYSHKDEANIQELRHHLSVFERSHNATIGYDGMVTPGQEWEQVISHTFAESNIVLLILSSDFIADDDCYKKLEESIALHRQGKLITVPIVMRECAWKETNLHSFTVLPHSEYAVVDRNWNNSDEPYTLISQALSPIVKQIQEGETANNLNLVVPSPDVPLLHQTPSRKGWYVGAGVATALVVLGIYIGSGKKTNPAPEIKQIPLAANEMLDERDGKKYKTVTIGNQTWMAQNLAFQSEGSYAYENNPVNEEKLGRLYTWEAAMRACPKGWRLPMDFEWLNLANRFGGTVDVATYKGGESAYDALMKEGRSGFDAVKGGFRDEEGRFLYKNYSGYYWSAKEDNRVLAYTYYFNKENKMIWATETKTKAFSCRCLKD